MKPRHSCFLKTDCWTGVLLFLDAATSYLSLAISHNCMSFCSFLVDNLKSLK